MVFSYPKLINTERTSKMKNLLKKLSAIAISAIMAVSALPISAYAKDEPQVIPEGYGLTEIDESNIDDCFEKLIADNGYETEHETMTEEESAEYQKLWNDEVAAHADEPVPSDADSKSKYNDSTGYFRSFLTDEDELKLYDDIKAQLEDFYWSNEEPVTTDGVNYYFGGMNYDKTKITLNRAGIIIRLVRESCPKYFFLYNWSGSNGFIKFKVFDEYLTRAEINRCRDIIENLTDQWMKEISGIKEPLFREEAVYGIVLDHIRVYGMLPRLDENGNVMTDENGKIINTQSNQNIVGALVNRHCMCTGYSYAMAHLCYAAGIDCIYVWSGTHAFNLVKLYGNWYCIDTTWIDKNVDDHDSNRVDKSSFNVNKSNEVFSKSGTEDRHEYADYYEATWKIPLPKCTHDLVTDGSRTVKVTFSGDGISIPAQALKWGEKALKPASPVKDGYRFGGWYKDSKYTEPFNFNAPYIYADTTLYARFTKIQSSDEGMTIEEGVLTGYTGNSTTFVVPADVHTIDTQSSFYTPYNNEKYEVAAGNNWFTAVDGVLFSKDTKTLVAYPRNKAGTSYIIPTGVKTLGKRAFYYNRKLETVTLPKGVESLENYVFLGSKLKHVNLPDSVTYIGWQVYSCPELADPITVPESVKTLSGSAFAGVKSKSVTINAQITSLAYQLFKDCTELEYVVLPATLTTMGEDVFSGCTSLKDIYFMGTKEQWDAIDKTKAALPDGVTMHYGEEPAPAGNVVATYGGSEHIFNDLTTLAKDKSFKNASGAVEITINADLTTPQVFTLPSKATSVTLKAPVAHTVAIKAATLSVKGNLTVENLTLVSGKKNTAITAKKAFSAANCTLGIIKVTGHADITNCVVNGTLTLSEKNNNTTLNEVTLNGNLTCSGGLTLVGCTITGDIKVTGILTMSSDSKITGKLNIGGISIV